MVAPELALVSDILQGIYGGFSKPPRTLQNVSGTEPRLYGRSASLAITTCAERIEAHSVEAGLNVGNTTDSRAKILGHRQSCHSKCQILRGITCEGSVEP
jgi:hypothetical protein